MTAHSGLRARCTLALVVGVLWFGALDYRKLAQPDEGRYAEISREMAIRSDWITPRLNGIKYFEKPPLQYWTTALAYRMFGTTEWTARLWTALTGFATLAMVWFTGSRLLGREAGLYAALVLASSFYFALLAHINTLDTGLTCFTTVALGAFLLGQQEGRATLRGRSWMWAAWTATALAVLSKGLIGVVLPVGTLVTYSLLRRDWGAWRNLRWASGLPLFLLVAAPWFIAVSRANPEFPNFFFLHEHVERFLTPVHHRSQPFWYFVPLLMVGVMPWLVPVVRACASGSTERAAQSARGAFDTQLFLVLWISFALVFFSASNAKLPAYILPLFPAAALLAGWRLAHDSVATLKASLLPAGVVASLAFLGAWVGVGWAENSVEQQLYARFASWLTAAGLSMALATAYLAWELAVGRVCRALTGFALGTLLASQIALCGHDALAPLHSAYGVARQLLPLLDANTHIYSVRTYDQTLDFYLQRTVTLVDFYDELEFGLGLEPALGVPNLQDFERAWLRRPNALAVMSPETFQQLTSHQLPMRVVARDLRHVIVRPL